MSSRAWRTAQHDEAERQVTWVRESDTVVGGHPPGPVGESAAAATWGDWRSTLKTTTRHRGNGIGARQGTRRLGELSLIIALTIGGLAVMAETPVPADTPETRRAAAEDFLAVVPVGEEIGRVIRDMSEAVPANQRAQFVEQMIQRVDMAYMKQVMLDGLVTDLSQEELKAAAAFYGTSAGKAIREKLPKVIDGIMPLIQKELVRTARQLSF
jgi:hypothetical protein